MSIDLFTDKKIKVFTIAMSNWRVARDRNIPLLDITSKAKSIYGPGMAAVVQYKAGMISEEDYSSAYVQKMRDCLRDNPDEWAKLLDNKEIAFACYCAPGNYCHRLIFKDLFKLYAEKHGYTVELIGELTKEL